MDTLLAFFDSWGIPRVAGVALLAVCAHLVAVLCKRLGLFLGGAMSSNPRFYKTRSVVNLVIGTIVFTVYFLAFGAILSEFGISLKAYIASASVIGLAVGFGSQSIVQDVLTGVTVLMSDLMDVNDMVEISGQTGVVVSIGMRFTILQNAMGAKVYIPNRSLTSLINYPRGYIRCQVDINVAADPTLAERMATGVQICVTSLTEQFPGILRAPVEVEPVRQTVSGKHYIRVKFRIWPNRGGPIETTFRQDVLQAIKAIDPQYLDNMIAVNYEVDRQAISL